jgi:fused signal recognition particle receptor
VKPAAEKRAPAKKAAAEEPPPPVRVPSKRPPAEAPVEEKPKAEALTEEALEERALEEEEAKARPSLPRTANVEGLRRGLGKSRSDEGFFGRLRALISGKREIDAELVADIEEVLLTSDVGVETTQALIEKVRDGLKKGDIDDPSKVWSALKGEAVRVLEVDEKPGGILLRGKPTVVLMIGVNGAGKTTTIGKLATKFRDAGLKVVLAAGDTFRAAAVQQLVVWGQRVGCEVVKGKDGADPGSVVFDAIKRAEETGADLVLADTAGRLHTKTNLMTEMKKIAKTAEKALASAPHETLLVIDATTGQNALAQAKEFKEALPVSGIVLTKLDGTAKGGAILGIANTLKLPVRFVGVGERAEDLHEFKASDFVEALLGQEGDGRA